MSRIIVVVAVIAAGVAAWLLFNEGPESEKDDLPTVNMPAPQDPDPGGSGLEVRRPDKMPDMERLALQTKGRLLMIARLRGTWTATLEQTFKRIKKLEYRTWYMLSSQGNGGGMAGPGRGLTELTSKPSAQFLTTHGIQALVFDEADPNELSMSFWNVVADRVRSGKMGLYFRPGFPMDARGQGLAAHPALSHPVLKDLLPVLTAHPLKGSPLPGIFPKQQGLAPTDTGYRHPATRLVALEEGSRKIWYAAGTGEGAIGSKFCYPTHELKPDAQVLINMQAGIELPAVIVSGGSTRVLWMGNTDFGDRKTHFARDKDEVQRTLVNHWWVWLMGQMPPE